MKKLFLKVIVLSLTLSNLSFDSNTTGTDLSTTDKSIIAAFVVIAGFVGALLYRDYKNTTEFIDYFDQTFGTKGDIGGISKLSKAINQKLLDQKISQAQIDKLSPKIVNVVEDLKNGIGKDIVNLHKSNSEDLDQFITKTSEVLKKSVAKNFGKYLAQQVDFEADIRTAMNEGPYGKSPFSKSTKSTEAPQSQAELKTIEDDPIQNALNLGQTKALSSSSTDILKSQLLELSNLKDTQPNENLPSINSKIQELSENLVSEENLGMSSGQQWLTERGFTPYTSPAQAEQSFRQVDPAYYRNMPSY